jgi:hypothetical protein
LAVFDNVSVIKVEVAGKEHSFLLAGFRDTIKVIFTHLIIVQYILCFSRGKILRAIRRTIPIYRHPFRNDSSPRRRGKSSGFCAKA